MHHIGSLLRLTGANKTVFSSGRAYSLTFRDTSGAHPSTTGPTYGPSVPVMVMLVSTGPVYLTIGGFKETLQTLDNASSVTGLKNNEQDRFKKGFMTEGQ